MRNEGVIPLFKNWEAAKGNLFADSANSENLSDNFDEQSEADTLEHIKRTSPLALIISLSKKGEEAKAIRILEKWYSDDLLNDVMDSLNQLKQDDKYHPSFGIFKQHFANYGHTVENDLKTYTPALNRAA